MRRQAVPSGGASLNIRALGLRFEMPVGSSQDVMQLSPTLNTDYMTYDLVPTTGPGLTGTFVYTGYVSTTNGVSVCYDAMIALQN